MWSHFFIDLGSHFIKKRWQVLIEDNLDIFAKAWLFFQGLVFFFTECEEHDIHTWKHFLKSSQEEFARISKKLFQNNSIYF